MCSVDDINFLEYRSGLPGTPDLEKMSVHLPVSWPEFRKQLKPRYLIVWRDVFVCYFLLLLGVGAIIFIQPILSFPAALIASIFSGMWIGYWLHSLSLFLHEAVHFNIHPNRRWNDILGNWLICPLLFTSVESYRKIHWPHHLYLGSLQDTEQSYFNALKPSFLLRAITAIHALKTIFHYSELETAEISSPVKKVLKWKNPARLVVVQSAILIFLISFGNYAAAAAWFLGVVIFWPFLGTIRQILRHRSENADPEADYFKIPHGATLRLFGDDWFSQSFGSAGFNRHMLHHWDPHISYTRLKDMEKYFQETTIGDLIRNSRTSYWQFFKVLLAQSRRRK